MHRFFTDQHSIQNDQFVSRDKELCHQVSKVLKMQAGKKIILCDNTEHEYEAEWTTVSKPLCEAKIISKNFKPDIGTEKPVHLYVSPLKNQNRWELILEKGTEIGVASFTPLITERTEVKELRKIDRLERIIKEAAEQSGRTRMPVIHPPISFKEVLEFMQDNSSSKQEIQSKFEIQRNQFENINLIASLHKPSQTIPKVLEAHKALKAPKAPISVYIGPVGDFSEQEIQQAIEHKFYPITLGSQVLRTETAAIVAAAQLLI